MLLPVLVTAMSLFPSPSRSPIDTEYGPPPVVKSTFAANDEVVIEPLVEMFLNTETVLLKVLVTAMSLFPSPSISPMDTEIGWLPVAKSTFAANDTDLPVELFLNTENVLLQ